MSSQKCRGRDSEVQPRAKVRQDLSANGTLQTSRALWPSPESVRVRRSNHINTNHFNSNTVRGPGSGPSQPRPGSLLETSDLS